MRKQGFHLSVALAASGLMSFGAVAADQTQIGTGGHHILSVAEAMARGLSPEMVITQASAHSAPTLGNEFKVVNWLRAAAIVARIDPVEKGYLVQAPAAGAGVSRL